MARRLNIFRILRDYLKTSAADARYYPRTDVDTLITNIELTPGPAGADGQDGAAATVAVGTVTTGAAGTAATVTNSGSDLAAVLDFVIPRGDKGDQGDPGNDGAPGAPGADGADGAAASVTVGTVTTGAAGSAATVVNAGTSSAAIFNFTIPRGDTGATGPAGPGLAIGGTTGQVLKKLSNADYDTGWLTLGSAATKDATTAATADTVPFRNDQGEIPSLVFAGLDAETVIEVKYIDEEGNRTTSLFIDSGGAGVTSATWSFGGVTTGGLTASGLAQLQGGFQSSAPATVVPTLTASLGNKWVTLLSSTLNVTGTAALSHIWVDWSGTYTSSGNHRLIDLRTTTNDRFWVGADGTGYLYNLFQTACGLLKSLFTGTIAWVMDTSASFSGAGKRLAQWRNAGVNVWALGCVGGSVQLYGNGDVHLYPNDAGTDASGVFYNHAAETQFSGPITSALAVGKRVAGQATDPPLLVRGTSGSSQNLFEVWTGSGGLAFSINQFGTPILQGFNVTTSSTISNGFSNLGQGPLGLLGTQVSPGPGAGPYKTFTITPVYQVSNLLGTTTIADVWISREERTSAGVATTFGVGNQYLIYAEAKRSGVTSKKFSVDTDGNLRIAGSLGVGNSAAATTLGAVVRKIEVFDAAGASLGYVPVYDAIT